MVIFPNCKINLGLNILQKREDGYHDLETVFFPIAFHDILEIISSEEKAELINTGILAGEAKNNLCVKAFHLIKKDFPHLPPVKMHLHKVIPLGAGLGGGSADAVFTLLLLNEKYDLQISESQLFEYALQLGSDCPFFLLNKACSATGRGEKLKEIPLSLSSYKICLINPAIHINTKRLFEQIKPSIPSKEITEIIRQPIETWKHELINDFEKIVFQQHPEIKKIKQDLYDHKAIYAAMTGTGSTVFGIFKATEPINIPSEKGYFHKWVDL